MNKKMYAAFYSNFFYDVSLWEKFYFSQCASHDVVITWFGHYVKLA